MEMESTRRSIDRSREPGPKKPRLIEDTVRDRSSNGVIDRERTFASRVPSATAPPPLSRFKTNERERDDSVRGVQSMPQTQMKPQQHQQELVNQYKTALAELTFNSKPIITNLTIIAGENLHVAKWIAATVCANILEVPSEQKLPSLYLLDSIVKNIGRDYVKYFAAKLPEVFCKAYRQVDSSIHPGMRHLFGTWKGVFPPACLQMIEKELGFPPPINGSSSGTSASRSDSQSQQRPAHSIHVNPKYLEARQRLQQSNRVKGINANSGTTGLPDDNDDDADRPGRPATIGSERPWADQPIKEFKRPRREASSESAHEKNGGGYEDYEYSSDLSRNSELGYGRASERVIEQDGRDNPWYGADKSATEATSGQRSSFDSQHEFSKYQASRPAVAAAQLQTKGPTQSIANTGSRGMNRNWKNSEEEEYMWDDMSSRPSDRGGPDISRKDGLIADDAENLETEDHLPQPRGEIDIGSRIGRETSTDSFSLLQRGQTAFGHRTSSTWPLQEPHSGEGSKFMGITSRISGQSEGHSTLLGSLSTNIGSSLARTGYQPLSGLSVGGTPSFGSSVNTISSGGILGQKRHQPLQPASPSGPSSMLQHPPSPSSSILCQQQDSHNLSEEDHLQTRSISQPGQKIADQLLPLNRAPHTLATQNSFPIISQNHIQPSTLQNLQSIQSQPPQHLQSSSSSMHFPQRRHHSPFSLNLLPEMTSSQPSGQVQKPLLQSSVIGNLPIIGNPALNHSSNPGADGPGQSNTSSLLAAIMKSGLLSNNSVTGGFPKVSIQDSTTLPSHLNILPPLPSGPPPTQLATSSGSMVTPASVLDPLTTVPQKTAALPPLPPGPPPTSSVIGTTSQTSSTANTVSNPLSSLLSSLVAKGLISSPAKESPTVTAPQVPSKLQNPNPGLTARSSVSVASSTSLSTITSSSGKELPISESAAKRSATLSQATTVEAKDLIGTEFKADIIRQSHPPVISGLFDDLPHQCNICGLRLKLRERLDRHLEWHASRKPEPSSSNKVSRRWYANSVDWVYGNVTSSSGPSSTSSVKVEAAENIGPVVPADETQCVCMLCGEPFDDFYSHERDEWMYKGAGYMTIPAVGGEIGTADENTVQGPIVHSNCISPSSVNDLRLMKSVKQEQTNE